MARIVSLSQDVIGYLGSVVDRPHYVEVATPRPSGQTYGSVPRIGIRPSYSDDNAEGVLLDGVAAGGPAAKAGMKEGDRIVEIAGKPVKNLEGYMSLIAGHKPGEGLDIGILRGSKK